MGKAPMPSIMAIDPGGTTGWCLAPLAYARNARVDGRFGKAVQWGQIEGYTSHEYQVDEILVMVRRSGVRVLVMETWDKRPKSALSGDALAPVSIDAMVKYGLHHKWSDVVYLGQQPSMMKIVTDDRLRRLGFEWVKTRERHQADAARHLVVALRRIRAGKVKLPEGVWL